MDRVFLSSPYVFMWAVVAIVLVLILWTETARGLISAEGMAANKTPLDADVYMPAYFRSPDGSTLKVVTSGATTALVLTDAQNRSKTYQSTDKATFTAGANDIAKVSRKKNLVTITVTNKNGSTIFIPLVTPNKSLVSAGSVKEGMVGQINPKNAKNTAKTEDIAHKKKSIGDGVPRSEIPLGDEDLYILKSKVVPPVCPRCPDPIVSVRSATPPPCPPCARCPEPAFECKKVPNYSVINKRLPVPAPFLNSLGV